MHKLSVVLLLASFCSLAACSNSDDQSTIEPTPDTTGETNQEPSVPEDTDTDEVLISTASLQNSGTDNEIPNLVAKTSFSFSEDVITSLSPDGLELANVIHIDTITRVSIYSTETQALLRDFSIPVEYGVGGRYDLVLWGQDDILTIIDDDFVGLVLNAKTGEVLVEKPERDTDTCSLNEKDISGFNPRTNTLYCLKLSNGMVNLIEIDTRTLTSKTRNSFTASATSSGARLSHDGSEVAFTVYESDNCCADPATLFVSTENFQPSREKQINQKSNQVMGNGFDVDLDELSNNLYIDDDGTYIDASSNIIIANYTRIMATVSRPTSYEDGDQPPDQGYRVITLPEGIVVGDISSPILGSTPEQVYMSIDGSVLALRGHDWAKVYGIDSRTNYTALTK